MANKNPSKKKEEEELGGNTWGNSLNWHSNDILLRKNGFAIHSRPKKGEPVWIKKGERFPQSEALKIVKGESVEKNPESK